MFQRLKTWFFFLFSPRLIRFAWTVAVFALLPQAEATLTPLPHCAQIATTAAAEQPDVFPTEEAYQLVYVYESENPYNGVFVYVQSPLGLDYVKTEGNDVYWVIQKDGFWYNPDVKSVHIGTVADGNVTLNDNMGGGQASLKVLKKYADKFWDRPGAESLVLAPDISGWSTSSQDWAIKDYIQHYARDYGYAVLKENRGMFQDKIGKRLDKVQTGLDVAGVADPTPTCDAINGLIYAGRGQWGYAGISAVAMVPYVGDLAKAGKYGKKAIVIGEGMADVRKVGRDLDAKWYQAWGKNFPKNRQLNPEELEAALKRNRRWIEEKTREGYTIYDIGPKTPGKITSPFYQLEKEFLDKMGYSVIEVAR